MFPTKKENGNKFPLMSSVNKESWVTQFSQVESISLTEVPNSAIPSFFPDHSLIKILIDSTIPFPRATWLIRVTFLNHLKQQSLDTILKTWTGTIYSFLCDKISEEIKKNETDKTDYFNFQYFQKLVHWMFCEQLIDIDFLFEKFLNNLESLNENLNQQKNIPKLTKNEIFKIFLAKSYLFLLNFISPYLSVLFSKNHLKNNFFRLISSALTTLNFMNSSSFPNETQKSQNFVFIQKLQNLLSFLVYFCYLSDSQFTIENQQKTQSFFDHLFLYTDFGVEGVSPSKFFINSNSIDRNYLDYLYYSSQNNFFSYKNENHFVSSNFFYKKIIWELIKKSSGKFIIIFIFLLLFKNIFFNTFFFFFWFYYFLNRKSIYYDIWELFLFHDTKKSG